MQIRSVAKIAVGGVFGGLPGALGAAASEFLESAFDHFDGAQRDKIKAAQERVFKDLQALAKSERLDDARVKRIMEGVAAVLARHVLTASELVAFKLDAEAATERIWQAATDSKTYKPAEEDQPHIRQAINAVYKALLEDREALPGLVQAFRHKVLNIPDDTVAALQQAKAAMLLVDPTQAHDPELHAPSTLLQAAFRVVPFHGREAICAEIEDWCDDGGKLGVWLFTGPGGTGKTRLLIEMCSRLRLHGWNAGFLDKQTERTAAIIDALYEDERGLFIVIDYAETRRDDVVTLLSRAASKLGERPIRVALLTRALGDWWGELQREGDNVGAILSGPAVRISPIEPLASDPEDRPDLFERAAAAFRRALGDGAAPVAPPDLSDDRFASALFLHMAALLAADQGKAISDPAEVMAEIAKRERRFWDEGIEAAEAPGLKGRPMLQAAALATLAGGADDRDTAAELISRAPLLRDQKSDNRDHVAELLHRSYPGERWLDGVTPDLLGEYLVARALEDGPKLLTAAVSDEASLDQVRHSLTVLTRMAPNEPNVVKWQAQAIGSDLKRLAEPAMAVAIETGDPIGRVLAKELLDKRNPELAARLESKMPHDTVALREGAWAATAIYHAALSNAPTGDNEEVKRERARIAMHLSNRLSALGERERALEAAQEAADLYRNLAATTPDAFRPHLAMSLNTKANRLRELGQRDKALEAAQEATGILRDLAAATPDAFRPDLAKSLNNLALMLIDLGWREKALEAAIEAADFYRDLVSARPDAFRPDLAMSLNNLASMLSDLGQHEKALEAAQEAADLYRNLAAARPDAFRPDLAGALNNLAIRLIELGQRDKAFEAAQESVDIRRDLVTTRPDAFQPDLAMSLNTLANILCELGQHEKALEAAQKSVDIRRDLAAARPDAFCPDLATSLGALSLLLEGLDRKEEAFSTFAEGVEILRPLFLQTPAAFASLMVQIVSDYLRLAEELGRVPDAALVGPVAEALRSLQVHQGDANEEP